MKIQPLCLYCSGEGCPACRETGVALEDAEAVTAIADYYATQKPKPAPVALDPLADDPEGVAL